MTLGLPEPRYFVVSDGSVYRDFGREIDEICVEQMFIAGGNVLSRPKNWGTYVTPLGVSGNYYSKGVLTSTLDVLHPGSSVIVIACQVAHYLGYKKIKVK